MVRRRGVGGAIAAAIFFTAVAHAATVAAVGKAAVGKATVAVRKQADKASRPTPAKKKLAFLGVDDSLALGIGLDDVGADVSTEGEGNASHVGPSDCVALWRNPDSHCVIRTKCEGPDISKYSVRLVCADSSGGKTRHVFEPGSFDPEELFDTLIICDSCDPDEEAKPPTPKANMSAEANTTADQTLEQKVQEIAGEVSELKADMETATAAVRKLQEKVFSGHLNRQSAVPGVQALVVKPTPLPRHRHIARPRKSQGFGKQPRSSQVWVRKAKPVRALARRSRPARADVEEDVVDESGEARKEEDTQAVEQEEPQRAAPQPPSAPSSQVQLADINDVVDHADFGSDDTNSEIDESGEEEANAEAQSGADSRFSEVDRSADADTNSDDESGADDGSSSEGSDVSAPSSDFRPSVVTSDDVVPSSDDSDDGSTDGDDG